MTEPPRPSRWGLLIVFALALSALGCWYVGVPASIILGTVSCGIGFVLATGVLVRVMIRGAAPRAAIGGAVPSAGHAHRHGRPDPAWLNYFVLQVWLDYIAGVSTVTGVVQRPLVGLRRAVDDVGAPLALPLLLLSLVLAPLAVPVAVAFVAAIIGAYLAAGVVGATVAVTVAFAWPVYAVATWSLISTDRGWRFLRRALVVCHRCYYVTRVPAYRCTGPHFEPGAPTGGSLHLKLRPGIRGVWKRQCTCGRSVPTTVLRAGRTMPPACPQCKAELPAGSGLLRTTPLAVFGGPGVGKSTVVADAVTAWHRLGGDESLRPGPVDADTADGCAVFASHVDASTFPAATFPGPPPGLVFGYPRDRGLVQIFDPAGDDLLEPMTNQSHTYLDVAAGLLFVIDATHLQDSDEIADEPITAFDALVARVRDTAIRVRRQRLAVVVTKTDLVHGVRTDDLRAWLCDRGQAALVDRMEHDFHRTGYFSHSATARSGDPAYAPLRWLLGVDAA